MPNEITPEQKGQLNTWAGQRDAILLEISNLQTVKENLDKKNKEIAESYTDTVNRLNQTVGRIEELKKQEAELPLLISKEISVLKNEKTLLESEIPALKNIIESLKSQKASLESDVSFASKAFDAVSSRTAELDKLTNEVTKSNIENERFIKGLVSELKVTLTELIDINKKNVSETNLVVDKLPKMLVELQKAKLIKNKI